MRDNVKGGALTEVTFYILLSLYTPKHGYAVMQFIEEKTGGRLSLGAGTLYGALNSLQEKEWIKPCGDCEGRKKEYIITSLGKEMCIRDSFIAAAILSVGAAIFASAVFNDVPAIMPFTALLDIKPSAIEAVSYTHLYHLET